MQIDIDKLIIREAAPEDAMAMLDYTRQVGGESDNLTFGKEGLPFTVEQEADMLASFRDNPRAGLYIAVHDGEIVGNSSFQSYGRKRMAHRARIALIVKKAFWGQGIGRRLLGHLLEQIRNAGCDLVTLEVLSSNERAIRLYEQFGFERFGELERFYMLDGQSRAALYMKLDLAAR